MEGSKLAGARFGMFWLIKRCQKRMNYDLPKLCRRRRWEQPEVRDIGRGWGLVWVNKIDLIWKLHFAPLKFDLLFILRYNFLNQDSMFTILAQS